MKGRCQPIIDIIISFSDIKPGMATVINAEQMRAARALLGWTRDDLAVKSGVSAPTIKLMETRGTERSVIATVNAVQNALEGAGVIFIPENGGGAGVRLKDRRS